MSTVINLPSKKTEAYDFQHGSRGLNDVKGFTRAGSYNPEIDGYGKFSIDVSYNGARVLSASAATMNGIADQIMQALRDAREIGYAQAQREIRESLGIER